MSPKLFADPAARLVVHSCARRLEELDSVGGTAAVIAQIRLDAVNQSLQLQAEVGPSTALLASILCDLRAQGWQLRVSRHIEIAAPTSDGASAEQRKAQIRAAHVLERDVQLCQAPTRRFVREMERRRLYEGSWHSIFSLMRDGRELAECLRKAAAVPRGQARLEAFRQSVDPYIQVVERGATCRFTGLRLTDVWRYFRHTWSTAYFSTPGRKVWVLVRDRAAPNHPVIGIGALGSAIVQLARRDEWIGWAPETFLAKLCEKPTTSWARWLHSSLGRLIAEIYVQDFRDEGVLQTGDLTRPSPALVARLRKLATEAWRVHRLYPTRQRHKAAVNRRGGTDWKAEARSYLFRAKRADHLAQLLEARRTLIEAGFTKPTAASLRRALHDHAATRAIRTVLRYVKASHVGVDMMDITICGAVAPYNALLGGKLLGLLMASPEVALAYIRRYRDAASIIASSMAGRPIRRRPKLVFLGTTSLYGVASSQYNRLRMPAAAAGGRVGEELAFVPLGKTVGFGSFHFSAETMRLLELFLARRHQGRPVNSIFGEGVNPKLRKVRAALDQLSLPSDVLLQHGSPRIVYGVPVATNFREVLMGRAKRAVAIVPHRPNATASIVHFWRERWLAKRIEKVDVLESVSAHSLAHPIRHGARVLLPSLPGEEGPLFANIAWPSSTVIEPVTPPANDQQAPSAAAVASRG